MTLLTVSEAAQRIRCSKSHLSRILAGRWDIPAPDSIRIGRRLLIRSDALEEWLLSLEDRESEAKRILGVVHTSLRRCR